MQKFTSIIIVMFLFLFSCAKEDIFKERQQEIIQLKKIVDDYCIVSLEEQKDWLISSIYFEQNKYSLKSNDISILGEIVKVYERCPKNILIIGHTSGKERELDLKKSLEISYLRAKNVKDNLEKMKIHPKYLHIRFCGNSLNKVLEDQDNAMAFNQRVEIIFIYKDIEEYELECIVTKE